MRTIERLHDYKDFVRTEKKCEEFELFEDLLLLAKLSEEAAKAAYSAVRCAEEKKEAGKKLLDECMSKLEEQYGICKGYFGGDGG